ncbi:hypothetical protein D3C72_1889940 [compost metagenome]
MSTPSTLPAHRMIFSRVAWSGATPNTVTRPCEPSTCTISPVASSPIFLMYASIASPAARLAASTFSADASAAAACCAALASPVPNSFSPASLMKSNMPMTSS